MTCFWDGILRSLDDKDFSRVGTTKSHIKSFIQFLKSKNTKNITTTWNGNKFTEKQCEENYQHVTNYNIDSIYGGYDCSTCDPFLILITQIFSLNTTHKYMGCTISYQACGYVKNVNYGSNMGHFYFVSCSECGNITEQPVVQRPVVQRPVVQRPVVNRPVVQRPVVNRPVVQRPVVQRPVVQRPVVQRPVVQRPVVQRPVVNRPVVNRPVVQRPVVQRRVIPRRAFTRWLK